LLFDGDPVIIGLVDSLNNPGGNATGLSLISPALEAKRLGLLRELVSKSNLIGVLANEDYPDTDRQLAGVETAAEALDKKFPFKTYAANGILIVSLRPLSQLKVDALLVAGRSIVHRAERSDRRFGEPLTRYRPFMHRANLSSQGGVMSYGASEGGCVSRGGTLYREDSQRRQARRFAGAIANQVRPGDQPQRPRKSLGLTVSPSLIARADEVIE
jgi:putative ABC transport system substrate-binding protein